MLELVGAGSGGVVPPTVVPLLFGVAALIYSAVGHAGASSYLAVMAFLGTAPEVMRPTALLLNLAVALIGSIQFARAGHFRWSLFWPFAIASIPMAFLGGRLHIPGDWYKVLVGVVLILSAIRFMVTVKSPDVVVNKPPLWGALLVGALLGLLAGLTGVGGGIFLSPLLLVAGWATVRTTAATSVVFILVNSAAGLLGQLSRVEGVLPTLDVNWVIAVVIGGSIGSLLGSKHLPIPAIRLVLAAVLVLAGAKLVMR